MIHTFSHHLICLKSWLDRKGIMLSTARCQVQGLTASLKGSYLACPVTWRSNKGMQQDGIRFANAFSSDCSVGLFVCGVGLHGLTWRKYHLLLDGFEPLFVPPCCNTTVASARVTSTPSAFESSLSHSHVPSLRNSWTRPTSESGNWLTPSSSSSLLFHDATSGSAIISLLSAWESAALWDSLCLKLYWLGTRSTIHI